MLHVKIVTKIPIKVNMIFIIFYKKIYIFINFCNHRMFAILPLVTDRKDFRGAQIIF